MDAALFIGDYRWNYLDYKVGDMVINPVADICGVVLEIEKNNLFDRLQCVKIMYVGHSKTNARIIR